MKRLLRAFSIGSASSLIVMAMGAATAKILTMIGGPGLLAVYGQLRQILQLAAMVGGLNGQTAAVRTVAAMAGQPSRPAIAGILGVSIGGALLIAAGIWGAGDFLARLTLGEGSEAMDLAARITAIRVVAVVLPAFTIGGVLVAMVNGLHDSGALARVQILGAVAALALAPLCAVVAPAHPAVLVLLAAAAPVVGGAAAMVFLTRRGFLSGLRLSDLEGRRMADHALAAVPLVWAGAFGLAALVAVRSTYIQSHGLAVAGAFEAANLVANAYVATLLSGVGTHLLPALSAEAEPARYNRLLSEAGEVLALTMALVAGGIFVFEPLILRLLFSAELVAPTQGPLRWMLLADYLRVLGWCYGTLLFARDDRPAWALCETAGLGVLFAGSLLVPLSSDAGGMLFLVQQMVYTPLAILCGWSRHRAVLSGRAWAIWIGGALFVAGSAWTMWPIRADIEPASLLWLLAIVPAVLYGMILWRRRE